MIFLHLFYQVNLFLHQSYFKKTPLPVKLTWQNMQENHFLIVKKNPKITESGQLWTAEAHWALTCSRACRM